MGEGVTEKATVEMGFEDENELKKEHDTVETATGNDGVNRQAVSLVSTPLTGSSQERAAQRALGWVLALLLLVYSEGPVKSPC